jgi:probable phosphoglycerate mutase
MREPDREKPRTAFFIMRHAPTEWNAAGRIQGQADSPLTAAGRDWASRWGRQLADLGLHRILSSDTGRAVATAHEINKTLGLPVHRDDRLREQDWGRWTGQTMAGIRRAHRLEFKEQEKRAWSFRPPGGEERLDVLSRAREALMAAGGKWPGGRLLVVSHEGVLKCLVYHLAFIGNCGQTIERMAPYHLHHLVMEDDALVLNRMNARAFQPPAD